VLEVISTPLLIRIVDNQGELFMTEPAAPATTPLFDTFTCPGDTYCEALSAPGVVRDHWRPLVNALNTIGHRPLAERQAWARRMRHEDGATFNPFDDPGGRGTPWALDVIPLPVTQRAWTLIEAGIIQRFTLLEQILADVYGPQNLIKDGGLPAEIIFANPRFLRVCHGIQPFGNRYLTYYAADIYRDAAGNFRVFRDYGACPAGLGYALENRIVMSRAFSELYHRSQVHRLAPFFHAFHESLSRRAEMDRDEPGIVLLSPGPESPIYFEHALLSRYLGYPLVEGQDLTVRNGQVFLKKLAGLEPVSAIFRHINDAGSDPFALRRESATGVAGLIQAAREQRVEIVNPIGCGFVDTPVLPLFFPQLCQSLLGGELILENHPVWWCGSKAGADHVRAHRTQLTIGLAMEPTTDALPPDDLDAVVAVAPHRYMAWEPVAPAVVPAWEPDGVRSRVTLLRVFACATEQGVAVMPGGLAMTAAQIRSLTDAVPERQQSKDIWVLSDQPVEPFSLLGGLQKVPEFRRSSDLPSRVADNLLWLGRYLERAEGLIRLLRSLFRRLSSEAALADIQELPYLLNLLRAVSAIPGAADTANPVPRFRTLDNQLREALFDPERPDSVITVLSRVQGTARNVRDRLSLDSWRVINRLEGFADRSTSDPLELLDDTLFTLSAFSGLAMESMTRGLGWRFMDMGRRVERGLHQAGLIRIGLPEVCRASRDALEALLEISDSIMTYRARYRTAFQLAPVMDLLIVDESNPKSLAFQCNRLAAHVDHLPRVDDRRYASAEERMALEMLTSVRLVDLTGLNCGDDKTQIEPLAEFLATMEKGLGAFARQVSAHYLSRVPETPHFSIMRRRGV
jgi:uncharacterized circularly permuted ATP-grasp superfamily protein/uncharacterized alpha-E superfamily protein